MLTIKSYTKVRLEVVTNLMVTYKVLFSQLVQHTDRCHKIGMSGIYMHFLVLHFRILYKHWIITELQVWSFPGSHVHVPKEVKSNVFSSVLYSLFVIFICLFLLSHIFQSLLLLQVATWE